MNRLQVPERLDNTVKEDTRRGYTQIENMTNNKIKVLDLFAGCGGMSYGFEQAGLDVVLANEIWEDAQETYKLNHKNTRMVEGDITKRDIKDKVIELAKEKEVNVVVGGPPCQAYSNAGLRNPDDPRGKLFEDYVEVVKNVRPTFFVMENVKGILTMKQFKEDITSTQKKEIEKYHNLLNRKNQLLKKRKQHKNNSEKFLFTDKHRTELKKTKDRLKILKKEVDSLRVSVPNKIKTRMENIGYKVKYKTLNSANYGVPQKRERVIFIGVLGDIDISYPKTTHRNPKQTRLTNMKKPRWKNVKETIDDLKSKKSEEINAHLFTNHSPSFIDKIKNTDIGEGVYSSYSDSYYRNPPDEPSRTVKENHGGVFVHYEEDRVMTPRELARLQSFPDTFSFKGSKSSILKQIGNAVPPELGKAIAEKIKEIYDRRRYRKATKTNS